MNRSWSLNPVLTLSPPRSLLSVYFTNTPKAHTSREAAQPLWSWTSWLTFSLFFFYRSGNGLAVFRRTELWMFPHNCAKHSHMQLAYTPSLFSPCENGMKLTCSEVICMSWVHDDVLVRSGLSRVLLVPWCMFSCGPNWSQMSCEWTPCNSSRTHWNWVFTGTEALLCQGNHSPA